MAPAKGIRKSELLANMVDSEGCPSEKRPVNEGFGSSRLETVSKRGASI